MTKTEIIDAIMSEVERAETIHPDWCCDSMHAAMLVAKQSWELIQAALDHQNEDPDPKNGDTVAQMYKEAVQTAAMTVRFLEGLPYYDGVLSDWVDGRPVNCRQAIQNGAE